MKSSTRTRLMVAGAALASAALSVYAFAAPYTSGH